MVGVSLPPVLYCTWLECTLQMLHFLQSEVSSLQRGGVTADRVETAREPETAVGPEDGTELLQSHDKP